MEAQAWCPRLHVNTWALGSLLRLWEVAAPLPPGEGLPGWSDPPEGTQFTVCVTCPSLICDPDSPPEM